jgi:protein TonB
MSAAAFELDAEPMPAPDPADAALLEYMPDSPASNVDNSARPAAESDPSKQYPWQPRKPLAEPMASALRKAAEAAGKSEFDPAAPHVTGTPQASATSSGIPQTGSAQSGFALGKAGAAAAPARAREIPAPDAKKLGLEPTASAITVPTTDEVKRIEDPSAGDGWDSPSSVTVTEAPSFGSLDDNQASDAGGSKKTLLIAVVLLGLAAAGYFGWTKMQSAHPQPAPQSVAPAMPALPPQPAASVPESQPAAGDVVSPQGETDLSGTTAVPASSKPSAAVVAEGPGLKASTAAKATPAEDEITIIKAPATEKTEAAPVLKVKNGSSTQAKPEPEAQEPVQAPAVTSIASGSGSSVLSGIVNTNAINAEKAPQQKLRISQGVSQGLIIKKVQPVYPPQARQMHLEGTVELQANVAESGSIASVKQLSGDRVLGRAAMDAVRQWKYKPYYLNGQPVEVETQITVNFKLP